jgi:hypothetical protein
MELGAWRLLTIATPAVVIERADRWRMRVAVVEMRDRSRDVIRHVQSPINPVESRCWVCSSP